MKNGFLILTTHKNCLKEALTAERFERSSRVILPQKLNRAYADEASF